MSRVKSAFSLSSLAVATAAGTALFVLAVSGGSYDLVDRQTAGLLVWWGIGVGALVVDGGPRVPRLSGVLVTLFAALIALWIAGNLGHSISEERSVTELARAVTHLGPLVLIGWVLPHRYWRAVIAAGIVAATVVTAASLAGGLFPATFGQRSLVGFADTAKRLSYPFGYWNAVGSWAVMCAVMLLATSSHLANALTRSMSLAPVPMAAAVVYLSYSRSALGAAVVGLTLTVALSRNRWTTAVHLLAAGLGSAAAILTVRGHSDIANGTGSSGAGSVLFAVGAACVFMAFVGFFTARFNLDDVRMRPRPARIAASVTMVLAIIVGGAAIGQFGHSTWRQFSDTSVQTRVDPAARLTSLNGSRIDQWRTAIESYDREKLHGTGAGTFELTNNIHSPAGGYVRDAHNAFLEAMSEQGFVGLFVLVGLILSMVGSVYSAIRRTSSSLDRGLIAGAAAAIGSFLLGTAVDWFWEVTALAMLTLTLTGAIMAAGRDRSGIHDEERCERDAPNWRRRSLRSAIVVVALVAALTELPGLVGTSDVRKSQRAAAAGNLTLARALSDQAIDTMPWASSPFLQRALVDERSGAWPSAVRSIQLGIRRDPYDWRLPLVLARIEARAGDAPAALVAYRKARQLNPHGTFFR